MTSLRISTDGAVTRVVLDGPATLNSLPPALLRDLIERCEDIGSDDSVRVVCLEGEGAAFSSGADLAAFFTELQSGDAHEVADLGRRATNALAELPQITIAGIRGHCVGGGVVLALACDARIASDDARFLVPELDAGIPLAWGGIESLARTVGWVAQWTEMSEDPGQKISRPRQLYTGHTKREYVPIAERG